MMEKIVAFKTEWDTIEWQYPYDILYYDYNTCPWSHNAMIHTRHKSPFVCLRIEISYQITGQQW